MGQNTIKALKEQVAELENSVKAKQSWNDYFEGERRKYQTEVTETHKVLSLMGVPQKDLPLPSRLTLLMTMIGMRNVIQIQEQEDR